MNTIPIQQFVQQVKAAELSNQREVKLDIKNARLLALCLAEVNAKLLEDYDQLLAKLQAATENSTVSITMDGGNL